MSTHRAPWRTKMPFAVSAFVALFGLLLGFTGWELMETERRYEKEGRTAMGTVIGRRFEDQRDSEDRRKFNRFYYIRYAFEPEGGQSIESEVSVAKELYDSSAESAPIEIQYLESDPSVSRVAAEESGRGVLGPIFLFVGSSFCLFALALSGRELHTRLRIRRLLVSGRKVDATVLSVSPGTLELYGVTQWIIRYSFRDLRGREIRGQTPHIRPEEAEGWRAGQQGTVRYDERNPELNVWVGK